MTKFVAVASAKGGVGKTTVALNLGASLQQQGSRVLVVDAHFSNPGLGHVLGVEGSDADAILKGSVKLSDAILTHSCGVHVLPLASSRMPLRAEWQAILSKLDASYNVVILDTPSGVGPEAELALRFVDDVLVVTTGDLPAVLQAKKTIQLVKKSHVHVLGVVVNKHESGALSPSEVERLVGVPVLTVFPYDASVRRAQQNPVVTEYPNARVSQVFRDFAGYLLGK